MASRSRPRAVKRSATEAVPAVIPFEVVRARRPVREEERGERHHVDVFEVREPDEDGQLAVDLERDLPGGRVDRRERGRPQQPRQQLPQRRPLDGRVVPGKPDAEASQRAGDLPHCLLVAAQPPQRLGHLAIDPRAIQRGPAIPGEPLVRRDRGPVHLQRLVVGGDAGRLLAGREERGRGRVPVLGLREVVGDRGQPRCGGPLDVRERTCGLLVEPVPLGQRDPLVHRLTRERVREAVPVRPCPLDQPRRGDLVERLRDGPGPVELLEQPGLEGAAEDGR